MASPNRFVRFGYRRPPPWRFHQKNPKPEPNIIISTAKALRENISNWPALPDRNLTLTPISVPQSAEVPSLSHGIDTVLRGDGLYPLEAPWLADVPGRRSKRRHFYSDGLRNIVHPNRIAWDQLPAYIPASKDHVLHQVAEQTRGVQYCSSSSSIIPALCSLYHLISNFRDTDLVGGLSPYVQDLPVNFARMHRKPIAFTIDNVGKSRDIFTINSHSGADRGPSILRDLGHSMERMLTTPPDEFADKFVTGEESKNVSEGAGPTGDLERQFFHYSRVSKFLLRAQIDCVDRKTGDVFDVKTRAVAPIRYDLDNYEAFASHRLRFLQGKSDSYEREFYDMVRSVFLKYALQLRIGRMAGALVAYHNTSEVLGLEYVRLSEMESYVFGDSRWSDIAFSTSLRMLEKIVNTVIETMNLQDGERAKVVLHTEWSQLKMYVFAQRVKEGERDPFGSEEFTNLEDRVEGTLRTGSKKDPLSCHSQWHLDASMNAKHQGFSIVGAHESIGLMGGTEIKGDRKEKVTKRRPQSSVPFERSNFDCSYLTDENFVVWELNVAPLVNGSLTLKSKIDMGRNDRFSLKYDFIRAETVRNEHLAKFVSDLGVIYLR